MLALKNGSLTLLSVLLSCSIAAIDMQARLKTIIFASRARTAEARSAPGMGNFAGEYDGRKPSSPEQGSKRGCSTNELRRLFLLALECSEGAANGSCSVSSVPARAPVVLHLLPVDQDVPARILLEK
jgi:hypothetical protein